MTDAKKILPDSELDAIGPVTHELRVRDSLWRRT